MPHLVEGLLYETEGVVGFFIDLVLPAAALGSIQPLTEMNTRDISSG
jgi:hypothetical protein